jgi:glycosyltransferase involved in cell wall biosynthesis
LSTYFVLIPSYNTGYRLSETVREALAFAPQVFVVVDGSTDGSDQFLDGLARSEWRVRVLRRPCNGGKGQAVLDGLREAFRLGFTHALVMDADGQHPAALIPEFLNVSRGHPEAMILGVPIFDRAAPRVRVIGRRLSNMLTNIETFGAIGDSLFGFRVYPVAPLLAVMESRGWMRRFDFDAEAVVRLIWRGLPAINRPAPVKYLRRDEGGVSHFRYGRDNVLLAWMHARLICEWAFKRFRSSRH